MKNKIESFLFEIGCEELPPGNLQRLANDLSDLIKKGLIASELLAEDAEFQVFASPRRLGVIVQGILAKQSDRMIERVGPAASKAFESDGTPNKIAEGFARSVGVPVAEIGIKDSGKGPCLHYAKEKIGLEASLILPEIIKEALNALPVNKKMRWHDLTETFVRPVHWLVALQGEKIVPMELYGLKSGRVTYGHRFHCPEQIEIKSPASYAEQLETSGKVIADFSRRKQKIASLIAEIALNKGKPVIDEALLDEVTGLVEWPVAYVGGFNTDFLKIPQECLISSMKNHQKYFSMLDSNGKLLPLFVLISNLASLDPSVVIKGNEKVITPRLSDAKFFFDQDKNQGLEVFNERLKNVVFCENLGTVFDKAKRVAKLASNLAKYTGANSDHCFEAGLLSKADLASLMVSEFPELQGIMGRYYAAFAGLPVEVSDAIDLHYCPRFSGDIVPDSSTAQAVGLSDKIDSIVGLFGINRPPSGSKDPFSLRRQAIGILRILIEAKIDLPLNLVFKQAGELYGSLIASGTPSKNPIKDAVEFVLERFPAKFKEEGFNPNTVMSVLALGLDSPYDIDLRVRAVQKFELLEESAALASANKRAKNILKDMNNLSTVIDLNITTEPAELLLTSAIRDCEYDLVPMIEKRQYTEALKRLSQIKGPTDQFFADVKIMAEDEGVRKNRLVILGRLRDLLNKVADISLLQ